jgi:hypothetical protein
MIFLASRRRLSSGSDSRSGSVTPDQAIQTTKPLIFRGFFVFGLAEIGKVWQRQARFIDGTPDGPAKIMEQFWSRYRQTENVRMMVSGMVGHVRRRCRQIRWEALPMLQSVMLITESYSWKP